MDKGPEAKDGSGDRELYFECLGQLVGLNFKPRSGLKEQEESSSKDCVLENERKDTITMPAVSLAKAKKWKPGALSTCLKKLGYDPNGKQVSCADPANPTPEEILPSLINRACEKSRDCETCKINEGPAVKRPRTTQATSEIGNFRRGLKPLGCPRMPADDPHGSWVNALPNFKSPYIVPPVPTNKDGEPRSVTSNSWNKGTEYIASNPAPEPSRNSLFTSFPSSSRPNRTETYENPVTQSRQPLEPTSQIKRGLRIDEEEMEQDENDKATATPFQSAYDLLLIQDKEKGIKREFGGRCRGPGLSKSDLLADKRKKLLQSMGKSDESAKKPAATHNNATDTEGTGAEPENPELAELMAHPQIKGFEAKIVESILSEVMEPPQITGWDDIAGLQGPKSIIKEVIIWPMMRPDIFNGLRAAPKGILLFGPPGTGKTMIGRLIATQSKSSFFNISASSLTSKWIGDGEKLVRCLFQIARIKQPSVIFIDEIDSILTQRSDSEHESSRRMKTEFLIQFDGCGTNEEDRVLVIGVTNRPQELDEAARRRLVKRIYIPLPDSEGRRQIVKNLMVGQKASLKEEDYDKIAEMSAGFSGADMKSLCQDASYGPIRDIVHLLEDITPERVRPIEVADFIRSLKRVKSSVADKDLSIYEEWDRQFGCHAED